MKPINIGQFNRRVQIFRQIGESDGMGGQIPRWVLDDTVWANVVESSGKRQQQFGQLNFFYGYDIYIRSNKTTDQPDFNADDFDPADFATALVANRLNSNYSIWHEGRRIILHSILEQNEWTYKIFGYNRVT